MKYKEAIYIPNKNPYLAGNPFVETLPARLSLDDFWDEIESEIEVPDNLDEFDQETKEQLASEIMDTVSPTSLYYDVYCDLLNMLKVSYKNRNPLAEDTQRWQHQIATSTFQRTRSSAPALKFTGYSGLGKTTLMDSICTLIDPVIHHPSTGPLGYEYNQIVYIKVNIPGDADLKQICLSIIREIDKVHGSKIADEYEAKRHSAKVCIARLTTLCTTHLVGMIIFDEIQNICLATPNAQKLVFTLFDKLSNEARVPSIKIGTSKANKLTHSEFTNARRLGVPHEWKNFKQDDEDWKLLVEYAWDYQLLSNYVELNEELQDLIYLLTMGISHCLFFLIEQANILGLRQGVTGFSKALLNEVYQTKFSIMKPALLALRLGKVDAFDDLMGAEKDALEDADKTVKKLLKIANDHKLPGKYAKELFEQVKIYLPEYVLSKTEKSTVERLKTMSALSPTDLNDGDLPL